MTAASIGWFAAHLVVALYLMLTGCEATREPFYPIPSPSNSMGQALQVAPECLHEGIPLSPACNEHEVLSWCPTEDSGIDSPGPVCFWQDPDTGDLWYSNGKPGIQW